MNKVLVLLIRGYQWVSRRFLRPECRFVPTCSEYTAQALLRHGTIKGLWFGFRRIFRCHPWSSGGEDPVP